MTQISISVILISDPFIKHFISFVTYNKVSKGTFHNYNFRQLYWM